MQQVYEINKIYTLRQSLSIRHVASGEEGVTGPLYFAQQRFLKYSNIKSELSRSCPSPPPLFGNPSIIEVKIKEMNSEDVVIKIMIIRYPLPPFSRFWKVGVLFVLLFFWLDKIIWIILAPTFKKRGYVPVYFEYDNFNCIFYYQIHDPLGFC